MNGSTLVADHLILRAGIYQFLALAYAYPLPGVAERLKALADALESWMREAVPGGPVSPACVAECVAVRAEAEREAEFNRLFSGAMAVAPHETAYERDIFRKQASLADIAGFYRAFGFELPGETRWQPDSAGVEMEFCSILLQRQARALEEGWPERVGVTADAYRGFLEDHLGRWVEAFAGDLERTAELEYYRRLAAMTRAWVGLELAEMGVEPDRLSSRQVYSDDLETPTCGGCTGCGPEGPVAGFGGPAGGCPPGLGPGFGPGGLTGGTPGGR